MANSNSMVLLPPRHTAQSAQDSSSSKPSISKSTDKSFEKKLNKAKNDNATAKTAATATSAKADAAKPAAPEIPVQDPAAPQEPAATTVDAKTGKPVPKTVKNPTDDTASPATDSEKDAKPDTAPAALPTAQDPSPVVLKKPVKAAKPVSAKGTDSADSTAIKNTQNAIVTPIADAGNKGDQQGSAQADDDADDGIAPVTAAEFGTGKIAAPANATSTEAAAQEKSADAAATAEADPTDDPADAQPADLIATASKLLGKSAPHLASHVDDSPSPSGGLGTTVATPSTVAAGKTASAATTPARFVEDNHPKIITGIAGQLLPKGGSMQLRLDPPELGALSVTVHLRDGVMTASFETSNDDATKLLSHSLGQLKSGLEAAGVTVDKIHVEQAPKRDAQGDTTDSDSKQTTQDQQQQSRQDQQRREIVRQMWQKLAGGDPLDLVA